MFRIRRIYDDVLPINQAAIQEVRQIFHKQFPLAASSDIDELAEKLRNPFRQQFRTVLYVAENSRGHVLGFAIVLHDPQIGFCYLDFLATRTNVVGRGVGAALYEHVRDEARRLRAQGLFFECLPDDPEHCADGELRKQNAARLRFYERYGARPIVGTAYETPLPDSSRDCLPHLVFDDLDQGTPLRLELGRRVVKAILERKYAKICSPEYVRKVLTSLRDDPLRQREFRYVRSPTIRRVAAPHSGERIAVTINDKHDIHHVRERGYVEAPVRIKAIRHELEPSGLIEILPVREYALKHIRAVHAPEFIEYLHRACEHLPTGKSIYPYVFPIRNAARPPKELSVRAGYFCLDTFTPLNGNTFLAAKRGVDCTLTAADAVLDGRRVAYALVRPPGHHAERRAYGGFCYFNNCAVAAHYLSQHGHVAILDIDYHHGNGQQDIFYERADVLTVSIHGAPDFAYPYFSGFADERGTGIGEGFNLNIPLSETQDGAQYRRALRKALEAVRAFDPKFLVVALGFDPAKGDPTGSWLLTSKDFEENGRMIGQLRLPTLVVQEGGYLTRTLGTNARHFFRGLHSTALEP